MISKVEILKSVITQKKRNPHWGKFIHIFGRQSVTEWHFTLRGQHPIGAGLVQNDSIG